MKKYILVAVNNNSTFIDTESGQNYEIYYFTQQQENGLIDNTLPDIVLEADNQMEALRLFKNINKFKNLYRLNTKSYYEKPFPLF